jgi:hypothetical protein
MMKTYEIEVTEVQRVYYIVEAEDETSAVEKYEEASVYDQVCMMIDSKGDGDTVTCVTEVIDGQRKD